MRSFRSLLVLLPLVTALPAVGSNPWGPVPERERQALIDLYESTAGDGWVNREGWLGPPGTECDWHGIECACATEVGEPCPYVFGINLYRNHLEGPLPASFGDLRHLRTLDLSVNRLRGELPPELGNLRRLKFLDLTLNRFSGGIPPELGNLTRLWLLVLSGNKLGGTLPPELANLKRLQILGLSHNKFMGEIPRWLGSLSLLNTLDMGQNRFQGPIPEELFALDHLEELGLGENQLTGRIPEGIGNHDLHSIFLQGNRLTGPIPESILALDFLNFIDAKWNALYPASIEAEQFINERGGGWVSTETLAPEGLTATPTGPTSVRLVWRPVYLDPIASSDDGGYLVYAKASSGAYRLIKAVVGKGNTSVTLTKLGPGTTYIFSVRTCARPHYDNKNTVRSELARPVTATTGLQSGTEETSLEEPWLGLVVGCKPGARWGRRRARSRAHLRQRVRQRPTVRRRVHFRLGTLL